MGEDTGWRAVRWVRTLGGVRLGGSDTDFPSSNRVEVTSKWLTEGESYKEVLIGYISGMGGRRGVVSCENQEISFPSEIALGYGGYRPHVNDWVKVCSVSLLPW